VNFGVRDKLHSDASYFLAAGSAVRAQFNHLKRDKYGHVADIIGRMPQSFWDSFERNYVAPLEAVGNPGGSVCECSEFYYAMRDLDFNLIPSYGEDGVRPYGTDALLELAYSTNALPDISPLFHPKLGLNGPKREPFVVRSFRCSRCKNLYNAVELTRTGKSDTQLGLAVMRRAPLSYLTQYLLDGSGYSSFIRELLDCVPRAVAVRALKKFARTASALSGNSSISYRTEYAGINRTSALYTWSSLTADQAALLAVISSVAFVNDSVSPKRAVVEVMNDPEKTSRLIKQAIEVSEGERLLHDRKKKNKAWSEPSYKSFDVLVQNVVNDIDHPLFIEFMSGHD